MTHQPETPQELMPGVWCFRANRWRTNAVLAIRDGRAMVYDPCWTPDEILSLKAVADAGAPGRQWLVLSHADCDHICGVPFFPDATVVGERRSASLVENGSAAAQLAGAAAVWGLKIPTVLRVDHEVEAGSPVHIGPFDMETIDTAGHAPDGIAYVLTADRLMLSGDYLSASMFPLVWWSLKESARATERLLAAIEQFDPLWIVPGHGPVLGADRARTVGLEDLEYFRALTQVAAQADQDNLSWAEAVSALIAIEPPRPSEPDMEFLAPRLLNATRALYERGLDPPEAALTPWEYLTPPGGLDLTPTKG
jgi:cyclase